MSILIFSSKIGVVKPHFRQEVKIKTTPSLEKAQMTLTLVRRWRVYFPLDKCPKICIYTCNQSSYAGVIQW